MINACEVFGFLATEFGGLLGMLLFGIHTASHYPNLRMCKWQLCFLSSACMKYTPFT